MIDADINPVANTGQSAPSAPNSASTPNTAPTVAMFGKMLTFTRIKLQTADLDSIAQHLATILTNKTSQIPVVIDSDLEQDLSALIDLFWSWGLQPIGVVAGVLDEAAKALRLAIFPADGKRIKRIQPAKKATTVPAHFIRSQDSPPNSTDGDSINPDAAPILPNSDCNNSSAADPSLNMAIEIENDDRIHSMIYDQMLRSGQSVNHVGGDLIVTNSVNNGAEAISDNCLHIYGRARGRLVAGATGDKDARIFCQCFNPSLVSVAGTYCLNDNIPAEFIDKPVQVSFKEGEGLIFKLLNNT